MFVSSAFLCSTRYSETPLGRFWSDWIQVLSEKYRYLAIHEGVLPLMYRAMHSSRVAVMDDALYGNG